MFEKEAEEYREKEKNKGYYWVTQEMEQMAEAEQFLKDVK